MSNSTPSAPAPQNQPQAPQAPHGSGHPQNYASAGPQAGSQAGQAAGPNSGNASAPAGSAQSQKESQKESQNQRRGDRQYAQGHHHQNYNGRGGRRYSGRGGHRSQHSYGGNHANPNAGPNPNAGQNPNQMLDMADYMRPYGPMFQQYNVPYPQFPYQPPMGPNQIASQAPLAFAPPSQPVSRPVVITDASGKGVNLRQLAASHHAPGGPGEVPVQPAPVPAAAPVQSEWTKAAPAKESPFALAMRQRILEKRAREGKTEPAPAQEAKEPAKEAKEPVKEAKEPVKEPVKEAKETVKEPVKEAKEPVKEPVKEAKEPVKEVKEPVKEAKEPVKEAETVKEPVKEVVKETVPEQTEAKTEPKTEPKVELKTEAEPKTETETGSKTETEPKESKPESKLPALGVSKFPGGGVSKLRKSVPTGPAGESKLPKPAATEKPTEKAAPKKEEILVAPSAVDFDDDDDDDDIEEEVEEIAEVVEVDENKEFAARLSAATADAAHETQPGRFVYDASFLHQFQAAVPPFLQDAIGAKLQIEKGTGGRSMSSRSGNSRQGSLGGMFGSGMRSGDRSMSRQGSMSNVRGLRGAGRTGSRRRGDRDDLDGGRAGSRRGGARQSDAPQAPVELRKAENAFKPRTTPVEPAKTEDGLLPPEEVQRKVKSLLNKMTLDNFERIASQIREISLQSLHETTALTLRQIIELTFAKAIDESHWSEMYARFFFYLMTDGALPDELSEDGLVDKAGNPVTGVKLLRRYLLSSCQREFEKGWTPVTEETQGAAVMSDEYYKAVKLKRRGLGVIRFIGELYKKNIMTLKLIAQCIFRLSKEEPTEDIVESMSQLLRTTAPRMIRESAAAATQQPNSTAPNGVQLIELAINRMREWRQQPGFPSRLKFMIMDVEEESRKGWKQADDKGPKTLQEVHQEAAIEARREAQSQASSMGSRRGGSGMPPRRSGNDSLRQPSGRSMLGRREATPPVSRQSSSSRHPSNSSSSREETPKASSTRNAFDVLSN